MRHSVAMLLQRFDVPVDPRVVSVVAIHLSYNTQCHDGHAVMVSVDEVLMHRRLPCPARSTIDPSRHTFRSPPIPAAAGSPRPQLPVK